MEVGYRTMATIFYTNLGIMTSMPMPMPMHYNNQATIFISRKLDFHERTKHIEIDYLFIYDKVLMRVISTPRVIIGPDF